MRSESVYYSYSAAQWLLVFYLYCMLGWCFESTVVSVGQRSLVNRLYAEAAATGSRNALREALEIDPALTGIDLLYSEGIVADMLENQKWK